MRIQWLGRSSPHVLVPIGLPDKIMEKTERPEESSSGLFLLTANEDL